MSVYTPVSLAEANTLLDNFTIGAAQQVTGITEGVVNSNFRLLTTQGNYILTLVENRQEGQQLPWLVTLLDILAGANLPTPRPIRDKNGLAIHPLHGKASLVVSLLPGSSPTDPTPHHCFQVGEMLARIHTLPIANLATRGNPMGIAKWHLLFHQIVTKPTDCDPTTLHMIKDELQQARLFFLNPHLPSGICHGDLFPDNTLFVSDTLTGVIDFHFACQEKWLYDLAISINAWCFNSAGQLDEARLEQLWQGYNRHRPLAEDEFNQLDQACRTASLRFAMTRLYARLFPRPGQQVTRKPPEEYLKRLAFHQQNSIRQRIKH